MSNQQMLVGIAVNPLPLQNMSNQQMLRIAVNPLPIIQLCIDNGLKTGYERALPSLNIPGRDATSRRSILIFEQQKQIEEHLLKCLQNVFKDNKSIFSMCIEDGLKDGYFYACERQRELPCVDDLIHDQYREIQHRLRKVFALDGFGYDEEPV